MNGSAHQTLSPRQILPTVAVPIFIAISNQTMVAVALPAIGEDLGNIVRLPWVVIGYMLALTLAGPAYGMLGDNRGKTRMLILAVWVHIAGTLLCAASPGMEVLAAGRIIQGFGGGGLMALSQALIGQMLSPRDRGKAYGFIATISVGASALGPVVGGLLVELLSWRWMFLSTLPLAWLAILLVRRSGLPEPMARQGSFDTIGFVCLAGFVCLLTGAVEVLKASGPAWIVAIGGGLAAVLLVALIGAQRRSANPLFPPRLFGKPAVQITGTMMFCHGATLVSMVTLLPLFLHLVRGEDALFVSVALLALTVPFGLSGMVTGNLVSVTGRVTVFPLATLPVAVCGMIALAFSGGGFSPWLLMAVLLVTGASIGTTMPVIHTAVQFVTPDDLRGRAAGSVTCFRSIGAVLGTALVTLILFALASAGDGSVISTGGNTEPADREVWASAFRAAFLATAGFAVTGWCLAAVNPVKRIV